MFASEINRRKNETVERWGCNESVWLSRGKHITRANGVTLQISSGTRTASKKPGDGKMDDINFVGIRDKNNLAGGGGYFLRDAMNFKIIGMTRMNDRNSLLLELSFNFYKHLSN